MALDDNTPVICVAEIPGDVLNDFFQKAYSVPEFADEGIYDVGMQRLQALFRPSQHPPSADTFTHN